MRTMAPPQCGQSHAPGDLGSEASAVVAIAHDVELFIGSVKYLGPEDMEKLTVESTNTEAVTTSEIEGETQTAPASSPASPVTAPCDRQPVCGPAQQGGWPTSLLQSHSLPSHL